MQYTLKLQEKKEVAKGVYALFFEKPEGFTFKAGQFLELHVPGFEPYYFSIASAPYENHVMIATRWRNESLFKKALIKAEELRVKGPYGNFTLHQDTTIPAIFLAGGIGITPFLSVIKQASEEKLDTQLDLFYINKTTQDALFYTVSQKPKLTPAKEKEVMLTSLALVREKEPFIVELYELQHKNSRFTFTPFLPKPVDIEDIPNYDKAKYYLCGSPKSIEEFKALLEAVKIPKEQIKTEDFPGYLTSL